ncbi:MAG: patatin-like phospholipase family protein [Pseudomonadota bacterium]
MSFKILSLDGGGSKGVYSLGVLREIESILGSPLSDSFDLIYGTSTGSIIAAFLSLGKSVDEITEKYFSIVPVVMGKSTKLLRSKALAEYTAQEFGSKKFDEFKTNIGIVATHQDYQKPMIFKLSVEQAHGRKNTFLPGFGCTIADAVIASCAAVPFFESKQVVTKNQGSPTLLDGGFVANNPTLFAIIDAIKAFQLSEEEIRVLSVGVGNYPIPKPGFVEKIFRQTWPLQLLETSFVANTNTIEQIRSLVYSKIPTVRVDETYSDYQYATSLLESDVMRLEKLLDLGRESFARFEGDIRDLISA